MVRNRYTVTINAEADAEGRVELRVPPELSGRLVTVTVEPAEAQVRQPSVTEGLWRTMSREEYQAFIERGHGIMRDHPLERPEQLPFEQRDELL